MIFQVGPCLTNGVTRGYERNGSCKSYQEGEATITLPTYQDSVQPDNTRGKVNIVIFSGKK